MNRGGPELFVLTDARHPLEVEAGLLTDVLECLLHHIIFHRALTGKAVTPKDMVLLEDLFYVKCGHAGIDKKVRDSAEAACRALRSRDRGGAVTLTFYERVAGGLLGDKMVGPWEEWSVHVLLRTEPAFGHREEQLRRRELEARVRELLWTVQKLVNSHRDHLPKEGLNDAQAVCYPFDIKDPSKLSGGGVFAGVGNMLVRAATTSGGADLRQQSFFG